jgi:hypothetical protein
MAKGFKITKIKVRFSRKVHPRQYNPVELEMEEHIDVEGDTDYVDKVRRVRYKHLKRDVDIACERILEEEAPKKKSKREDD